MAAAPQFDLFAGAKGYEYARDRNTQDEDNALKSRQNALSLDAFEKQLREYDKGAELRTLTRENNTAQAKGRGVTLQQQNDYHDTLHAARASLTPAQLADTSAMGNLNRMYAMQQYMQTNKATPTSIETFGKEMSNANAQALAHAQYDPAELNAVLQHPALGGGQYMVNPVPDMDGQFRVMKQGAPDGEGFRPYFPIPNSQGNLQTVAYSLASRFPNSGGPDRGSKMGFAFDTIDRNREVQQGAQDRGMYSLQLQHVGKQLADKTANRKIDMSGTNAAAMASARVAHSQMRSNNEQANTIARQVHDMMQIRGKNAATQPLAVTQQQDAEIARLNQQINALHQMNVGHNNTIQQAYASPQQPQYTSDQQTARENAPWGYTPDLFNPYATEADMLKNNPQLDDGSYDNG